MAQFLSSPFCRAWVKPEATPAPGSRVRLGKRIDDPLAMYVDVSTLYECGRLIETLVADGAALAYDRAALRLHRARARLNFDPVTGEEWLGNRNLGLGADLLRSGVAMTPSGRQQGRSSRIGR